MQATLEFNSEMGGGIVLIEPEAIAALGDDTLYWMNIAVDPTGSTDIVCDYAGQDWQQVWAEQTYPLVQMARRGQMSLAVTNNASYKVQVVIGEEYARIDALLIGKQALQVSHGRIAIVEAGGLLETKFSDEEPQGYASFELANGLYIVTFFRQSDSGSSKLNMAEVVVQIASTSSPLSLDALADTLPYIQL